MLADVHTHSCPTDQTEQLQKCSRSSFKTDWEGKVGMNETSTPCLNTFEYDVGLQCLRITLDITHWHWVPKTRDLSFPFALHICFVGSCARSIIFFPAAVSQLDTRELLLPKTSLQREGRALWGAYRAFLLFYITRFYSFFIFMLKINILKGKLSLPERAMAAAVAPHLLPPTRQRFHRSSNLGTNYTISEIRKSKSNAASMEIIIKFFSE